MNASRALTENFTTTQRACETVHMCSRMIAHTYQKTSVLVLVCEEKGGGVEGKKVERLIIL